MLKLKVLMIHYLNTNLLVTIGNNLMSFINFKYT